jgi:type IV pilus assembly protein PilF
MFQLASCATTESRAPEKWQPDKRAAAHVELGLDYLRRDQYDVAREELDLAVSIDPDSDEAHHGKALLMAEMGYPEEAISGFARAVRLNPRNYVAINDYGIYLCQQGQYDAGLKVLQQAEERPDNRLRPTTWLGIGLCHYRAGDTEQAQEFLRQVLKVTPTLTQALEPMADMSYRKGNYLSSRAFVERFIATGAITEGILVTGANTELQLGDGDKARQYISELRRRFPESTNLAAFRNLTISQ